jgi:hypothetical protein
VSLQEQSREIVGPVARLIGKRLPALRAWGIPAAITTVATVAEYGSKSLEHSTGMPDAAIAALIKTALGVSGNAIWDYLRQAKQPGPPTDHNADIERLTAEAIRRALEDLKDPAYQQWFDNWDAKLSAALAEPPESKAIEQLFSAHPADAALELATFRPAWWKDILQSLENWAGKPLETGLITLLEREQALVRKTAYYFHAFIRDDQHKRAWIGFQSHILLDLANELPSLAGSLRKLSQDMARQEALLNALAGTLDRIEDKIDLVSDKLDEAEKAKLDPAEIYAEYTGPAIAKELDILDPRREIIPFVGRTENVRDFWNWLVDTSPGERVNVRTIVGGAGNGKTRFAIHLARLLHNFHPGEWWCAFVKPDADKRLVKHIFDGHNSLLIVDYAASQVAGVKALLKHLDQWRLRPGSTGRVRVLLLERDASEKEGWLSRVAEKGGDSESLFAPSSKPFELSSVPAFSDQRVILESTLAACRRLGFGHCASIPKAGENPVFQELLKQLKWQGPLYLQMAAIVGAHSNLVDALSLSRLDLAHDLANRELRRMRDRFFPEDSEFRFSQLVHAVKLVTLAGGASDSEVERIVREARHSISGEKVPGGWNDDLGAIAEKLRAAVPGLRPITPDIVGEAFLLSGKEVLTDAQVGRAWGLFGGRIVPALIRATTDFGSPVLQQAMRREPLGWLNVILNHGEEQSLEALESAFLGRDVRFDRSISISGLAARVFEDLLKLTPEGQLSRRGQLLGNLSVAQSSIGNRAAAADLARRAVEIYEELAENDPNAFLPDFALSVNNRAFMLSDIGQRDGALVQARRAVEIYERLAEANPKAFLPDLAMSVNNLAKMLSEVGQREAALEQARRAVEIYRKLAEANPDAFLPNLAASVNNLALILSAVGQRDAALEHVRRAVEIREKLAEANPDAFLPDLALSVNNLATMLSDVGQRGAALEQARRAAEIYGKLAEANPDAFLPALGTSVNNLANRLGEVGQRDAALEQARRAVEIREKLAEANPDAFLPDLAKSSIVLALQLAALGQLPEARAAAERALHAIEGPLSAYSQAHRRLAAAILQEYLEICEQRQQAPPDEDLVQRIQRLLPPVE